LRCAASHGTHLADGHLPDFDGPPTKEGRRRILIAPSITTGLVVMPHFSDRLVIALPGVIDY
jgi:hypothetical protein